MEGRGRGGLVGVERGVGVGFWGGVLGWGVGVGCWGGVSGWGVGVGCRGGEFGVVCVAEVRVMVHLV